MTAPRVIGPQAGPQTAFASSPADIAIYGGSAGGGKSWSLLFEAARGTHVAGYAAMIFRRNLTSIVSPGGLFDASRALFPLLGARAKTAQKPEWVFPNSTRIGFDHLDTEGAAELHQGAEYAFIGFDELTHISERNFWYATSRNRSTCGVRPYVRATCNPDPDSFVRRLIDWWIDEDTGLAIESRSGVLRWFVREGDEIVWAATRSELDERYPHLDESGNRLFIPKSLTFVRARLDDNPILTSKDPAYRATLMALPRIDRERLLSGNWNIRPSAGEVFQRSWFSIVDVGPTKAKRVRAWDFAATEVSPKNPDPDWTVGALMAETPDKHLTIEHIERGRWSQAKVEAAVLRMAEQDGKSVHIILPQDPGAAGKNEATRLVRMLTARGYVAHARVISKDKITMAKPLSARAENGGVSMVRAPWNEVALRELEALCENQKSGHDDIPDALSLGNQALSRPVARYAPASARVGDDEERDGYR